MSIITKLMLNIMYVCYTVTPYYTVVYGINSLNNYKNNIVYSFMIYEY